MVIGGVRAVKNRIHASAGFGQNLVQFVVDLVQSGHVKQTTPQARLVGGNHRVPSRMVQAGDGIYGTGQGFPLVR